MRMTAGLVMVGGLLLGTGVVGAQATPRSQVQSSSAPSVTATNSAGSTMATDGLLTSTVHEAWVASGRNEDKFFDMVKTLAAMSAEKRGVTLPDTEATGRAMGMAIKASARRDPDQLLYAVVDAAVRKTAAGTGTTTPAATK
jgi:hypothetical protein